MGISTGPHCHPDSRDLFQNPPCGGLILYIFSFLVGAATWFFGAAATFTSFGWFGLIIGLIFMGIGVVPLGIIGGFIYLDPGFAIGVIIMLVLTFAFRTVGLWLMAQSPD